MKTLILSLVLAVAVSGWVRAEGGCCPAAAAKSKCTVAVTAAESVSSPVVTSDEDTYASVLTDQEGNLSMFAQQPLVSVAADGIMAKKKAPEWPWDLEGAAVMYGCLAAHELVGRAEYLDYVRAWADHHTGEDLAVTEVYQCAPGMALVALYEETGEEKYLAAARKLGDFLLAAPAAPETGDTPGQMEFATHQDYIDTMLITSPFLAKLGDITGNYRYRDMGAKQIIAHIDYLRTKESMHNLFAKIYDFEGPKKFPYLDDGGQGWIFMQIAETADLIPEDHPESDKLAYILSNQGCATLKVSPMVFGKAAGSLTISYSHAAYTYGAAKLLSGGI